MGYNNARNVHPSIDGLYKCMCPLVGQVTVTAPTEPPESAAKTVLYAVCQLVMSTPVQI